MCHADSITLRKVNMLWLQGESTSLLCSFMTVRRVEKSIRLIALLAGLWKTRGNAGRMIHAWLMESFLRTYPWIY
jgi:hypothetical protein